MYRDSVRLWACAVILGMAMNSIDKLGKVQSFIEAMAKTLDPVCL